MLWYGFLRARSGFPLKGRESLGRTVAADRMSDRPCIGPMPEDSMTLDFYVYRPASNVRGQPAALA